MTPTATSTVGGRGDKRTSSTATSSPANLSFFDTVATPLSEEKRTHRVGELWVESNAYWDYEFDGSRKVDFVAKFTQHGVKTCLVDSGRYVFRENQHDVVSDTLTALYRLIVTEQIGAQAFRVHSDTFVEAHRIDDIVAECGGWPDCGSIPVSVDRFFDDDDRLPMQTVSIPEVSRYEDELYPVPVLNARDRGHDPSLFSSS